MDERLYSKVEESAEVLHQGDPSAPATGSTSVDIIVLDDDSDVEESGRANSDAVLDNQLRQLENNEAGSASRIEDGDEPMSLSDLSSSFQKCFPLLDQTTSSKMVDKSQPSEGFLQVQPFDYEAARKQVKFGEDLQAEPMVKGDDNIRKRAGKKSSVVAKPEKDEGTTELPQGRRRQSFPASGNRSATFR